MLCTFYLNGKCEQVKSWLIKENPYMDFLLYIYQKIKCISVNIITEEDHIQIVESIPISCETKDVVKYLAHHIALTSIQILLFDMEIFKNKKLDKNLYELTMEISDEFTRFYTLGSDLSRETTEIINHCINEMGLKALFNT